MQVVVTTDASVPLVQADCATGTGGLFTVLQVVRVKPLVGVASPGKHPATGTWLLSTVGLHEVATQALLESPAVGVQAKLPEEDTTSPSSPK